MIEKKNKIILNFVYLAIISLLVRFLPLVYLGPQWEPDSQSYITVAKVLADTGNFATLDPDSGRYVPFAMRVPLFHLVVAQLSKIFGPEISWPIAIMNVILSTITVLLTAGIGYFLVTPAVGYLAGYLMAFNPNSVYNSLLVMPDSFFAFFCLCCIAIGIIAILRNSLKWYLIWGISIGLTALIKPVFKFYWVIPIVLLIFKNKDWKIICRYSLITILGVGLVIGPWILRNYKTLGFIGLDVSTGINSIWSITDLVKLPSEQQRLNDPELAKVQEVVVKSRETLLRSRPELFNQKDAFAYFNYSSNAWGEVQKQLGLSVIQTDRLLTRLAIVTVLDNPGVILYRCMLNTINFWNSPASLSELICLVIPGGRIYRQPLSVAWQDKKWVVLLPTIAVRLLYLFFLMIAAWGVFIWWQSSTNHNLILFLVLTMAYFTIFSFTAGYDRYRLPVDPLLIGLASISIHRKLKIK
jgi:4-amino-4-deoxy-L-arabinose transferase-like glycosyltransferase